MLAVVAALSCSSETRGDLLRLAKDSGPPPVPAIAPVAKLIENGHDCPTGVPALEALQSGILIAEERPFDGMVLDLGLRKSVFTSKPFVKSDVAAAIAAVKQIPFRKLTENFQALEVVPGDFDWFDDASFASVRANLVEATLAVKDAGLLGFWVDTQPYQAPLWSFATRADGRTFDQWQAQMQQRGYQMTGSVFDAYPQVILLLDLAYSEVFRSVCLAGRPLEEERYALLPSFLDGALRAAAERGAARQIIDGFIGSYATTDPAAFEVFYHLIHYDWDALAAHWYPNLVSHRDPDGIVPWNATLARSCDDVVAGSLARDLPAGFGLMMDYDFGKRGGFGLTPSEFARNYFPPENFEVALRAALSRADRYVWVWNQSVDWWGASGMPAVPDAYVNAVASARTGVHQN
jgi:hypothetical protein